MDLASQPIIKLGSHSVTARNESIVNTARGLTVAAGLLGAVQAETHASTPQSTTAARRDPGRRHESSLFSWSRLSRGDAGTEPPEIGLPDPGDRIQKDGFRWMSHQLDPDPIVDNFYIPGDRSLGFHATN